jgi:hypothetical protein
MYGFTLSLTFTRWCPAFESLISCLKQANLDPLGSSILCEICAVAVVAGQYVRDSLEPGLLDRWYSRSEFRKVYSSLRVC